jgi:cytochrome c553
MFVFDVVDDDYTELQVRKIVRLGHNPRAVRFSPDGSEFYVLNALDFAVAVFDSETLEKRATIAVSKPPYSEEFLLGKRMFYTALEPMVGRRWISCSSCHPDGDPDGRTWQNPEGLRNTQALAGMAWTHPIHWSADRDEVQDFEETIRGPLMQGRGLLRGQLHPGLGAANGGRSPALDALAVYSNGHQLPLSPHAKTGLSESAQRGRELFRSARTKCAECHSGPFLTDSSVTKPFKLHDVGTGDDDATEKMGPKYDTPSLLGLYRTAPYLHDGRAKTIEEVLTTANEGDRHGVTSGLSQDEVRDLAEYLRSLPYEDPVPAAESLGVKRVAGK